jgi:thioredoxin 1
MADIKKVNTETFETEVLKSEQPVLVDFYASWCAPCTALMPTIERVADGAVEGKYKVVKLDTDDAYEIAEQYKVKTIPTLMVFKNGAPVKTQIGRTSLENILKMFDDEKV